MNSTTRVELHCHSSCSDGVLSPGALAEALASSGVAIASLTDHNTVDGLLEFGRTLRRREIGFIPGVEITTQYGEKEAHLLAYGFDPGNAELLAVLKSLRQVRPPEVQSVAGSIRRTGSSAGGENVANHAATGGRIDIREAIAVVHRAGGKAFLAHPLFLEPDSEKLEAIVAELKHQGLDGIEAIYAPFTADQQSTLCEIASRHGLLVSAGTDFHADQPNGRATFGIDMPTVLWKRFRDAVRWHEAPKRDGPPHKDARKSAGRPHWRAFAFHIVVPALLSLALFMVAIFAVLLPNFERSLIDRKREMIRELTNSAWSILNGLERDVREGRMTRSEAQKMAVDRIQMLRYGRDGKDYFWLQDMHPRMIMHPYRTDLNGQDVGGFTDPRGVRIFSEFASLVRRGREGYVDYVWQWKDDPSRLVAKESYIKGFQPWGWIIGTGIYVEDVREEIRQIEGSVIRTSLGISFVVALLLLYVIRRGLGIERERAEAEQGLIETTERYRSLVEATSEGTLLVTEGRCRYANPVFLSMVGRTQEELQYLDLSDLFPETTENEESWRRLERLLAGEEVVEGFDAVLQRKGGERLECVLAASRLSFVERSGFILLVRDVRSPADSSGDEFRWRYLERVVERLPIGIFRARASARGTLVEFSRSASHLLGLGEPAEGQAVALADLFEEAAGYSDFLRQLETRGEAAHRLEVASPTLGQRTVAIAATLDRDEDGRPRFIDGIVEDVTTEVDRVHRLEVTVRRLQDALMFLHEPVGNHRSEAVRCGLETPVGVVAALMAQRGGSAALVESPGGEVVGIVTDSDLRKRVLGAGIGVDEPVSRIMSAPVSTVSETARVYEALMRLESEGVGHLATLDDSGCVTGILRRGDLTPFRSYGPVALLRQIRLAGTPEEVALRCRKAPELVRTLVESGVHPREVTGFLSSVCDEAAARLIELAELEFGPSPVSYAFVALGSHGRQEMTLSSDQDNAIVFADCPHEEELREAKAHLDNLGAFVCDNLARAGFALCPGEIMAKNPKWCQPISVWKQHFSDWIALPEPQQLLEFTVFFDFRLVYGSASLCRELRSHLSAGLEGHPPFYAHFAQSSLLFKPPTRAFGRLVPGVSSDSLGNIDLKQATMPIVSFARLYALRHGSEATHTLRRLENVVERGALKQATLLDASAAYERIMRTRLDHQSSQAAAGLAPDNRVNYRGLRPADQAGLNESFSEIAAFQQRIVYDFLGGATV